MATVTKAATIGFAAGAVAPFAYMTVALGRSQYMRRLAVIRMRRCLTVRRGE